MIAKAIARYIRITPRKVGYVITPLRKRTVAQARNILATTKRGAVKPITKLLNSAFANAQMKEPALREEEVVISKFTADSGPTWKRFRAVPFGKANRILKRTTHITVELEKK